MNFQLDEFTLIGLVKIRTSDFYKLFKTKTHAAKQKGPQTRDNYFLTKKGASLKTLCKEPNLKEFQFKLMHRILVIKRKRFRYDIQMMSVYTVAKKTPLTILLATTLLSKKIFT